MSNYANERPLKLRLMLYLYSNANIAGCALALLGPALLVAGVIGPGWLLITAGLYAVFLVLAVRGYIDWRRSMATQHLATI